MKAYLFNWHDIRRMTPGEHPLIDKGLLAKALDKLPLAADVKESILKKDHVAAGLRMGVTEGGEILTFPSTSGKV